MTYKYGEFSQSQVSYYKDKMQKSIFFLLLIVDPKTSSQYDYVDVNQAFKDVLSHIGGFNGALSEPPEMVEIISLLEAARIEYNAPEFNTQDFKHCTYRKLVLDAGAKVKEIKEVD